MAAINKAGMDFIAEVIMGRSLACKDDWLGITRPALYQEAIAGLCADRPRCNVFWFFTDGHPR